MSTLDGDLQVLAVEDLAEPAEKPAQYRPPWTRVGASALALVAVGALVTIGWEQREQTKIARHQACITDAQAAASFTQSQGAMTSAMARCFRNPQAVLGGTQVVVPGVVSVRLGEAMTDLTQVGLQGRLINGPAGVNAYIIDQAPRVGVSVPAGTVVEVSTRSP
jgi:hypothetical protein